MSYAFILGLWELNSMLLRENMNRLELSHIVLRYHEDARLDMCSRSFPWFRLIPCEVPDGEVAVNL